MSRKIAIVGKAPSSFRLAPFDDPEWEIWVLNDLAQQAGDGISRWDRHFDLHDLHIHKNAAHFQEYWQWMQEQTKPLYLREADPAVPAGVVYPFEEVLSQFRLILDDRGKPYQKPYITNSISWMIALALHEGCDELGLYGVDMAQHGIGVKSEYAAQRPSCELFVGIALGMGVKVTIPRASDLCKARRLYGVDDPGDFENKLRVRLEELKVRKDEAESSVEQSKQVGFQVIGALQEVATLRSMTNGDVAPLLDEREKILRELLADAGSKKAQAERLDAVFYGAIDDLNYVAEWV